MLFQNEIANCQSSLKKELTQAIEKGEGRKPWWLNESARCPPAPSLPCKLARELAGVRHSGGYQEGAGRGGAEAELWPSGPFPGR